MEDDEDMQERWANLLANAATTHDGLIKIAYPEILSELEPNEAATLDRLCDQTNAEQYSWAKFGYDDTAELASIPDSWTI
jgi:Abortive infection alpha